MDYRKYGRSNCRGLRLFSNPDISTLMHFYIRDFFSTIKNIYEGIYNHQWKLKLYCTVWSYIYPNYEWSHIALEHVMRDKGKYLSLSGMGVDQSEQVKNNRYKIIPFWKANCREIADTHKRLPCCICLPGRGRKGRGQGKNSWYCNPNIQGEACC